MPGPDDLGSYRPAGGELNMVPGRGCSGREHRVDRRVNASHRSASALDGRPLSAPPIGTARSHGTRANWRAGSESWTRPNLTPPAKAIG